MVKSIDSFQTNIGKLSILDSTFNQEHLENVAMEIDEWKLLGFLIGDRNSQDDFNLFCIEEHMRKKTCTMLMQWQKMHPYASWTLLYQALIKMNENVMSQHILKKYLSGLLEVLHSGQLRHGTDLLHVSI